MPSEITQAPAMATIPGRKEERKGEKKERMKGGQREVEERKKYKTK